MLKLVDLKKSNRVGKKYMVEFLVDNDKIKTIHFGQSGARDNTLINDKNSKFYLPKLIDRNVVKASYLRRHREREDWSNPLTAGALSRWLLWDKKTLSASLKAFKKRFKL
tara:strand:- start:303 stop:632 length:330 start_codon:yes stop_codon:yes gene_type:complete